MHLHPFFIRALLRLSVMLAAFGAVILAFRFPAWLLVLLVLAAFRPRRRRGGGYAHGTAAFATLRTLLRHGMLGNTGLIVGRTGYIEMPGRLAAVKLLWASGFSCELSCRLFLAAFFKSRVKSDVTIRVHDAIHATAFAGTGRGKGVSLVVPNLMAYPGSCVVTDISGELVQLTARHRQRFGHRIVILDPFHLCGGVSDHLNPLDWVDATAPDFLEQVRDLANALIFRTGTEREPHWNESAEIILVCFIAFVCACETNPAERNLMTVRHLLASKSRYEYALSIMQKSPAAGGVVRTLAEACSWYIEKEGASVMTTLNRQTGWMDSPSIAAMMGHSSFDPRGLKSGKLDLYLVLPPERLASMPAVMRMWVDTVIRVLCRDGAGERQKILFLLDEIGHLGHIQSLENAVTLMRKYGLRLFFFFQSVAQVKDCFGDRAGKFMDNIDTKIFFGLNATESAEAVSKLMGDQTISIQSYNETRSRSGSLRPAAADAGGQWSEGSSTTHSEMGRPLMRPDEILRAPPDFGIVIHKHLDTIPVRLIRYYDDPAFQEGGTGVSPALGVSAVLASAWLLALGVGLLLAAVVLPEPRRLPPPLSAPLQPQPNMGGIPGSPLPSPIGQPPYGPSLTPPLPAVGTPSRSRASPLPASRPPYPAPGRSLPSAASGGGNSFPHRRY